MLSANKDTLPNPLIVIRFAVFALLVYLNFLILVFASWHIHATLSAGLPVPGGMVVLIFNSCTLFFFLALGIAEFLRPYAKTSCVKFECGWSGALTLFQIGATVSLTVNGPVTTCLAISNWDICASSSLLFQTTWSSSLLLLAYFFSLCITAAVHAPVYPGVWSSTIFTFPWFQQRVSLASSAPEPTSSVGQFSTKVDLGTSASMETLKGLDGDEKSPSDSGDIRDSTDQPRWAQSLVIRRGVDTPFTKSPTTGRSSRTLTPPPAPPKAHIKSSISVDTFPTPRYVRQPPESRSISRDGNFSEFGMHPLSPTSPSQYGPFPPKVDDHDLPIPLPRLSEWIRADDARGINVHTVPKSP